ncbi:acyl carrier protein [Propioniciclava tarda]|nr:acyl carrier protein [Propioniciclava tarda]SMO33483.1 Acyl carrier protein [Propioniciclava tarda]
MDEFLSFVAKIMKVDPSQLSGETAYGSIPQWDSLMHLRLLGEIEDEYDVEIPIDEVPDIKTLADFFAYVA